MTAFLERIKEDVLVCFGAIATMVQERGFDLSGCLGQWLMEHPEDTRWLTRQYLEAGCEVLGSAGSQFGRWRLAKWGLEDKVIELNRELTGIIKEVTPRDCYVAGTIAASGRMLQPLGDATPDEIYDGYREEALGYAEGGADVIWVMTMSDIEEAVLAVRATKDFTGLPVIATMSFDTTPKGCRTMMGIDSKTAAQRLAEAGADLVGHNCGGATPEETTGILNEMGAVTDRPLVAKPNAGIPEILDGRHIYPATPERYAAEALKWMDAGARVVGGCCGSGPEQARQIFIALKGREP